MSINSTVLVGRLTKEADLRYTGNGTAVATFTLAVNRSFKNQNGEYEADFINCVIWRKSAENLANLTHKGSQIGVVGRIQTRNYENQQGNRVFVTEVVADNFQLLEPKSQSQGQNNGGTGYQNQNSNNHSQNNQNANSGQYGGNNTQGGFDPNSIDDSMLPF